MIVHCTIVYDDFGSGPACHGPAAAAPLMSRMAVSGLSEPPLAWKVPVRMSSGVFRPSLADLNALLAEQALAPVLADHVPFFIAATYPVRLTYVSGALQTLFAETRFNELEARLMGAQDGHRRLDKLCGTLVPGGGPQLHRLRAVFGPRIETLTLNLRRTAAPSSFVIGVVAGVRVPQPTGGYPAPLFSREIMAEAPASLSKPSPAAPMATRAEAPALAGLMRFLWQSDAGHRLSEITAPLCEALGYQKSHLIGHSFPMLASVCGEAASDALADALDKRDTFSGLELHWPLAAGSGAAHIVLGGLPAFDAARNFLGYRGFGTLEPVVVEAPAPAPEQEPAPRGEPAPQQSNVVPLRGRRDEPEAPRAAVSEVDLVSLSPTERNNFREIARALGGRVEEDVPAPPAPASVSAQPSAGKVLDDVALNARRVLDRIPVGVLVSRMEIPLFLNRTLLDLIGYEDVDAFHDGGGLDSIFEGPSDAPGLASIRTTYAEVISVDVRIQAIDWDGEPATLTTIRRPDGETSPRIRALEADLRLREGEARELHTILDTATDGIVLIDASGVILSLNRSAEALFGYEQADVAGQPFTALMAKESHATVSGYLDSLKSEGVASVLNDGREVLGRARQGGDIPLFMTVGRITAGQEPKFCAVLRDLTSWKKAETELQSARREAERSSALKSDFLAKVSHEIRTPLNAILGFAEVIIEERFGPLGNERYRDYLKDIHSSGAYVMSLVNDLLDLSKIEAGKLELNFASVDANRIVAECVSLMQPQANRERIIIRVSLAPRLPNLVADERSLRQIVLNILSNAVKFNEPGGQVIVSTALTDAGHAVIRIRDTGIGMSESELETALEPFRQVATSRRTGGTGLGLPLTKALVEANRASFTIKSAKQDGTLVEVSFPPTRVLAE